MGTSKYGIKYKKSTESGSCMSGFHLWITVIPIFLAPSRTAPRPRSRQPPSSFRLPETKYSQCRYEKYIILLYELLFSLFLSATVVPRCTYLVTVVASHLCGQHKNFYCTVLGTELIILWNVCIRTTLCSRKLKFLSENSNPITRSYTCTHFLS